MKITDILEHQNIQEGPLDTIGTAVGKTVGGVAKAAGAVAGGIAGIGTAVKKGYQAGKATVGGEPTPQTKATTVGQQAGSKIKAVGQAAKDKFNKQAELGKGLLGIKKTDKETMQDPFEIIKSLNQAQKQKLYNLL